MKCRRRTEGLKPRWRGAFGHRLQSDVPSPALSGGDGINRGYGLGTRGIRSLLGQDVARRCRRKVLGDHENSRWLVYSGEPRSWAGGQKALLTSAAPFTA